MISGATRQTWDRLIAELEEHGWLNDWENEFIDSLSMQRSQGRDLSFKQSKVLRRIAAEKGIE